MDPQLPPEIPTYDNEDPYTAEFHLRMTVLPQAEDEKGRDRIAYGILNKVVPKVHETMHLLARMAVEYELARGRREKEATIEAHARLIAATIGRDRDGPIVRNPIFCKKDGKCYCVHGVSQLSSSGSRGKGVIVKHEGASRTRQPCPPQRSQWPDCDGDFVDEEGNAIDLLDVAVPHPGISPKRPCKGCDEKAKLSKPKKKGGK